ncbi:hypothetical protein CDL15_Pgr014030 [Punica granatum]|uniref:Uncharacterized protein n=1 Tax=Punica granatum TaxID=22663 RepID=A0A218WAP4_PUNGR|nr:hypothetical protein CDL15_Pgr014030 [Punica granatum]
MSGPPRVRSTNIAEAEPPRPVLRPAGNNAPSINSRKPASKPSKKSAEKPQQQEPDAKDKKVISSPSGPRKLGSVRAVLQQQEMKVGSNLAMNASCSSDASSSDSSHSRASSGKLVRRNSGIVSVRRKQCSPKAESVDCVVGLEKVEAAPEDCGGVESIDGLEGKKRCPWVTANSGALAELTWPSILTKRHIFREVFLDFDPVAVSKLNEKKIVAQGGPASALLSEPKVRAILENARQFCKVIEEFGSFNKYIWNFVNNKPSVSQFRYPRQVPVKSSKAEFISKDLVRRGFRSVGPTVVYSFMQVAGLTNDHLISCFRFHECIAGEELAERNQVKAGKTEARKHRETTGLGLSKLK